MVQQNSSIAILNSQFVATAFSGKVSEGNDNLSSADSYNIISTQRIGILIRIISRNKDATFWRWFWSRGGSSCSSCRCRCRSRSRGNLDWNSKLRVIGGAVLIRTKSLQDSYVCLGNIWRYFKIKKKLTLRNSSPFLQLAPSSRFPHWKFEFKIHLTSQPHRSEFPVMNIWPLAFLVPI